MSLRNDYGRLCSEAAEIDGFTRYDLETLGWTAWAIGAAVQKGFLEPFDRRPNGKSGSNPQVFRLTKKGTKRAAEYNEYLAELARLEDDGG